MNALSLSESTPSIANGRSAAAFESFNHRGSGYVLAWPHILSSRWRYRQREGVDESLPSIFEPPQCSTMSISKKPGGGSRQSAKVRTGMLRRMAEPTPVRRLRRPSMCARAVASMRSMLAALTWLSWP